MNPGISIWYTIIDPHNTLFTMPPEKMLNALKWRFLQALPLHVAGSVELSVYTHVGMN